jgi:hypothetical protein
MWLNNGGWTGTLPSLTSIDTGEWFHVAGFYDGASIGLYVNGILETSSAWAGGALSTNTNVLFLGAGNAGAEHFYGTISELVLFNRAMKEPEVIAFYMNAKKRMPWLR